MEGLSICNDRRFGCQVEQKGVHFGIYSNCAHAMVLEVYQNSSMQTPIYKNIVHDTDSDGIFTCFVPYAKAGMYYVWRIMYKDYSYSPTILDPYAKGVTYFNGEWRNIIVASKANVHDKPKIPWKETIIYELHVGHFTKIDDSVPKEERGTFKGLIRKIPYFKKLGVTTLELLPIFKWYPYTVNNCNPYTGQKLEDVWGYNPISFFAIDERYGVDKENKSALEEFKLLVDTAHKEGIEIILDVVYNHSGEGGEDGIKLNYKYLAPDIYYKFNDQHKFLNCSGTGNTLNTNHPIVKELIKASLTYWANEVGVDGFRFDLASILGQDEKGRWLKESLLNEIATDKILSQTKLITEGWDAKGSYDVGRMPYPFCEWSDYFRDSIRKFVKGDQGIVAAVTDCMQGKEIYFTNPGKGKDQTIHFITAHDGFTMWDLVSYNQKHNEANGEYNRDGHNANCSYNWGVEGKTSDRKVLNERYRAMRNLRALQLLSKGTPMLLMGDEFARTQQGNNNAYCQDNELVWVDWNMTPDKQSLLDYNIKLIELRKSLDYFNTDENYEISWHGVKYKQPDLSYYSCSIACYIEGKEDLFIIANSYYEPLTFELPPTIGKWKCILNTSDADSFKNICVLEPKFKVDAHTICVFKKE